MAGSGFSGSLLRFVVAAVAAMAMGCALFFWLPGWYSIAGLTLLAMLAPAAIISAIVFARGATRAFAIGCAATGGALPMAYIYFSLSMLNFSDAIGQLDDETAAAFKVAFAILLLITLGSGMVAVGVRWLVTTVEAPPAPQTNAPLYEIIARRDLPADVDYAILQTRIDRG